VLCDGDGDVCVCLCVRLVIKLGVGRGGGGGEVGRVGGVGGGGGGGGGGIKFPMHPETLLWSVMWVKGLLHNRYTTCNHPRFLTI